MAVSFAKLPDLIRGPQAEASPLTLLEFMPLARRRKILRSRMINREAAGCRGADDYEVSGCGV